MSTPKIILLAWFALSVLLTISQIGKPRKPLEPTVAAISVALTGTLAWLVVIA